MSCKKFNTTNNKFRDCKRSLDRRIEVAQFEIFPRAVFPRPAQQNGTKNSIHSQITAALLLHHFCTKHKLPCSYISRVNYSLRSWLTGEGKGRRGDGTGAVPPPLPPLPRRASYAGYKIRTSQTLDLLTEVVRHGKRTTADGVRRANARNVSRIIDFVNCGVPFGERPKSEMCCRVNPAKA